MYSVDMLDLNACFVTNSLFIYITKKERECVSEIERENESEREREGGIGGDGDRALEYIYVLHVIPTAPL